MKNLDFKHWDHKSDLTPKWSDEDILKLLEAVDRYG